MPSINIPQNNDITFPSGTVLPKAADQKLTKLKGEMMDLTGLVGSSLDRIRSVEEDLIMERERHSGNERAKRTEAAAKSAARIEDLEEQRRDLSPVFISRNERANEIGMVLSGIREWAAKLPAGARLQSAPAIVITEWVAPERVQALRVKIDKLISQRGAVQSAPPAAEEVKARIALAVDELAARGGPELGAFLARRGRISFSNLNKSYVPPTPDFEIESTLDVLSLLAWFDPGQMVARLSAEVDATRKAPDAELTDAERAKRLGDVNAQLLALERQEEALIVAAKAHGQEIPRRPSASPLAILGIVVAS